MSANTEAKAALKQAQEEAREAEEAREVTQVPEVPETQRGVVFPPVPQFDEADRILLRHVMSAVKVYRNEHCSTLSKEEHACLDRFLTMALPLAHAQPTPPTSSPTYSITPLSMP